MQPLRLEIRKKLSARSERVKCCDFHTTEPWILASLYSGHLFIWNYVSQSMVKSIEVCDLPVRAAKFIPSKQWIVCGSDDMQIRVYNYNTMERLRTFEAHTDYIRSLAIHPTLPYLLSSSDDMLIKLWDWDKGWECIQVFEGHTHYVMQVEFNPKDANTFASASLDRSVKIWGLNSPTPHFQLEGHERGVNCIGYFRGGDRPYLVSGADDHLVKIWDYQTKACVATLEGHTSNVSAVCFHPELPIIVSGSEDGTVRIWHANTYRLENTLNYGMERVWTLACLKGSNKVAIGYDDGTIMIKIGHEEPVASMERGGKIVWAHNHEIVLANVRQSTTALDGDRLDVQSKDLGSCELYPQSISHDPKGRLLCACGDGEYIIYTALALKNKSFGSALEFVWANDSGVYATRESTSKVKVFKDFKEHKAFRPTFAAESIYGGALLGVRSNDFIDFYDWNECKIIRRIDVCPRRIFWSESGELVVLACEASFYILRYNADLVAKFQDQSVEVSEQGIENSFELEQEVAEKVRNGNFVGDCFIYTNAAGRLNYYVGGEIITLAHLNKQMYLLGYLPKENRVYLMDKAHNIYSYALLLSILIYQTAIVRRDFDGAKKALVSIPVEQHNKLARFLESQDLKDMALRLTTDSEHKFELAIACGELELAKDICVKERESEEKWKQLGDLALSSRFDLQLTLECYARANDFGGLLLVYSSMGDVKGMETLAEKSRAAGRNNVAFLCYFLLHRIDDCVALLTATDRIPEAAFLTRTYVPSHISDILALWKDNVKQVSVTAAEALADPNEYSDRFPDLEWAVKVERWREANEGQGHLLDARVYGEGATDGLQMRPLIEMMKEGKLGGKVPGPVPTPTPAATSAPAPASAPVPVTAPAPAAVPAPTVNALPASPLVPGTITDNGVRISPPMPVAAANAAPTSAPVPPPKPSVTPPVAAAPIAATIAASPARPLPPVPTGGALTSPRAAPPVTRPPVTSVPATPDRAKISPPQSNPGSGPSSAKGSPAPSPTAKAPAPSPFTPAKPAAAAVPTVTPGRVPPPVKATPVPAAVPVPAPRATALPVTSMDDLDEDFADLDGGAGGGVPSLDDINSSLADIDDEFREFE